MPRNYASQSSAHDRFTGTIGDFTIRVFDLIDPSHFEEVEMPSYSDRKQVAVIAEVTNNGSREINLSYSLDLEVKIGAKSSLWSTVGYLDRVPGNPARDEMLRPGETSTMTWVFVIGEKYQPRYIEVEASAYPGNRVEIMVR